MADGVKVAAQVGGECDQRQMVAAVNVLKDLFRVRGTHFMVAVADDAMRRFATRSMSGRDAFESAFDTVIELRSLRAEDSLALLGRRARDFPHSASLFCHAWSGGLPCDLIRAGSSAQQVNALSGGVWHHGPRHA